MALKQHLDRVFLVDQFPPLSLREPSGDLGGYELICGQKRLC